MCLYCSSWEHHHSLCPHPIPCLEASLERPDEHVRASVKRQRAEDDSNRSLAKRPSPEHHETVAPSNRQPTSSNHRNSENRNRRQGGSPDRNRHQGDSPSRRRYEEEHRRYGEGGHRQGGYSHRHRSEERNHQQGGSGGRNKMEDRQSRRK